MKPKQPPSLNERAQSYWASLLGVCGALTAVSAAETNAPVQAPPPITPTQMFEGGTNSYSNWIDFSVGGFLKAGNKSQFQQTHRNSAGPFGGIEDFHYEREVRKGTVMSIDGRSLFETHDYGLKLGLVNEKTGYLRFSYGEFRSWYDGDGGLYAPTDGWYPLGDDPLALDRRNISFEAGLSLDKLPKFVFKYDHRDREGEKSSTAWGLTHPAGGALLRGITPSFYDINERSDAFQLDATHHVTSTDFGIGLRYESGKIDDALKIRQFPLESMADRRITDREGTTFGLFNVHAFSETWLKKNILFSSGVSFSDLDNDFSGSRIYGSDFDVNYAPGTQNGFGYYGLNGGSRLHEYVMDLNLMVKPSEHFSVVPSVRVQREDSDAVLSGMETAGTAAAAPFSAANDRGVLDVRERLDLTYNGITNWVYYARGELTEGDGNLREIGGLIPIGVAGVPAIRRDTDDQRFFQKYSAGARWYPLSHVTFDAGGYYRFLDIFSG